ncbi:MAG: hypothetical protein AAFR11_06470 [Pseudomonadota bacterium]
MRVLTIMISAGLAATLASCGGGYRVADEPGARGYYEEPLSVREWKFTFRPITAMRPETAESRVLRRVAEVGDIRGYDWFEIETWETRVYWMTARGGRSAVWRDNDGLAEIATDPQAEFDDGLGEEIDPSDPNAAALRAFLQDMKARDETSAASQEERESREEIESALNDPRFRRGAPVTAITIRYGLDREPAPEGRYDIDTVLQDTANR